MASYAEQSDYVLQSLSDRAVSANALLVQTTQLIESVRAAITTAIASITNEELLDDIDKTFLLYTLEAVDPEKYDDIISDINYPVHDGTEIFRVDEFEAETEQLAPSVVIPLAVGMVPDTVSEYQRAQAYAAAYDVGAAQELEASQEAALRGVAVPPVVLYGMATTARAQVVSAAAKAAGDVYANDALRVNKNVMDLTVHDLQRYEANAKARLEWNKLTIDSRVKALELQWASLDKRTAFVLSSWKGAVEAKLQELEVEKTRSTLAANSVRLSSDILLKQAELSMVNSVGELTNLTQVYAQLCNAMYSASDTSLSAGTSFGISGPFKYNPDAGEVAWFPTAVDEGGGGIQ